MALSRGETKYSKNMQKQSLIRVYSLLSRRTFVKLKDCRCVFDFCENVILGPQQVLRLVLDNSSKAERFYLPFALQSTLSMLSKFPENLENLTHYTGELGEPPGPKNTISRVSFS